MSKSKEPEQQKSVTAALAEKVARLQQDLQEAREEASIAEARLQAEIRHSSLMTKKYENAYAEAEGLKILLTSESRS